MAGPSGRRGVSRDFPGSDSTRNDAGYGDPRYADRSGRPRSGPPPGGRPPGGLQGGRPASRQSSRQRPRKGFIDYPRHDRDGFTRWIPSWKFVGSLVLTGTALIMALFFAAYASTPIPDGQQSATFQTSTVYYRDGSVLGRFQQQNRTLVTIKQVPQSLRYAVYAAEDRSFETNSGVSVPGMVRALLNNAQGGGGLQGGSTITQQYVKNYYLSSERTYSRKVKELFISLKVGRKFTKDQILEGYLNTIYFGRGANGVQAASRVYFGKNVEKLTVSESAFLAGIINGPELYDPFDGNDSKVRAEGRWKFVVNGLVTEGRLSAADAAKLKFPKVIKYKPSTTPAGYSGYLLSMVTKEAGKIRTDEYPNGIDAKTLNTAGLDIYTTFDKKLMDASVKAVDDMLPEKKKWPKGTQIAMATIDVPTGEIRSIYGGADFLERQQNGATQDVMQAGSTAKPFALLAALRGKQTIGECRPQIDEDTAIGLDSRFDGRSPQDFPDYDKPVRNFGNSQYGLIDLRKATASSVNTVYVALNEKIGPDQTEDAAVCAGLPKETKGLQVNLANVLGTFSPRVIDMAHAYSTIANNGNRTTQHSLLKIVTHQNKKQIYSFRAKPVAVFDPNVTANVIEAMQQVVTRGSGTYAQRLDRPVAGKTGTSSNNLSAWFTGFTPELATSVAMYRISEEGNPLELEGFGGFGEITGGSLPIRVWTDYMSTALNGQPVKEFPQAQPIGQELNPAPPTPTEQPSSTPTDLPTFLPPQPPEPTDRPTPTFTNPLPPTEEPVPTDTETPTPTLTPTPTRPGPTRPGTATLPPGVPPP